MTSANMSCPSGGSFYACGDGSKFVGCCSENPCSAGIGCAAGSLAATSFDADQYDTLPDQECSAGQFWKCSATDPPFWGCCSSNPCSTTTGCPKSDLDAAFLSDNAALADVYLSLNTTWLAPSATASASVSASGTSSGAAASKHTNTGAIAGGVVGGIAVLAAFIFGLAWLYRRRRHAAVSGNGAQTRQQDPNQLQEMYPQPGESNMKHMAGNHNDFLIGSPGYSPRPPSYWSEAQARHVSYELPGTAAGVELEDATYHSAQQAKVS